MPNTLKFNGIYSECYQNPSNISNIRKNGNYEQNKTQKKCQK